MIVFDEYMLKLELVRNDAIDEYLLGKPKDKKGNYSDVDVKVAKNIAFKGHI